MKEIIKPEVLAPAGDFERLCAAVEYGADAVYLGSDCFGMRTAAASFGGDELKKAGHTPIFLLGARTKNDLLLLDKFQSISTTYVTTEDASEGAKGFVTQHSVLQKESFEFVYCCGPGPMMKAVAQYASKVAIECEVSLENKMACGIGACLCCVENTTKGNVCVCKEGPVFNIKKLQW